MRPVDVKLKGHLLSIHMKQKPFYSVMKDNQPVTAGRGRYVYYTVCLAYSVLYEVLVKKKITLSLFRNVFLYDKIIRDGDYLLVFVYCMMLIMFQNVRWRVSSVSVKHSLSTPTVLLCRETLCHSFYMFKIYFILLSSGDSKYLISLFVFSVCLFF